MGARRVELRILSPPRMNGSRMGESPYHSAIHPVDVCHQRKPNLIRTHPPTSGWKIRLLQASMIIIKEMEYVWRSDKHLFYLPCSAAYRVIFSAGRTALFSNVKSGASRPLIFSFPHTVYLQTDSTIRKPVSYQSLWRMVDDLNFACLGCALSMYIVLVLDQSMSRTRPVRVDFLRHINYSHQRYFLRGDWILPWVLRRIQGPGTLRFRAIALGGTYG